MADPLLSCTGNTGGTIPLVHKGKTYNFHYWTDAIRARYTQWAKTYAMSQLRELLKSGVYNMTEYQEAFNGLRRDFVNGEYNFGKEPIRNLISSPDGFHILVRVLLNDDSIQDDEIKSLIDERGDDVVAAWMTIEGLPADPKT